MVLRNQERTIRSDRVAIYIRWSTDDQSDGTTLEVQLEGCKHYLLSQGWAVNEELIFVDDGWSGGNLDRPALKRLRKLVLAGRVDCIVVFKLDRLSRSVIDMVNLVLQEWEGLTHVKSAREPVDTASAMGKQFFYMLVSFAEWERNVIRERTSSGRIKRAQEGYKASSIAPYGYRHGSKKGSLEIDENERALVYRIFDLYIKGSGAKAIVCRLNEEGFRNRSGEMWNERTVLYMLSNQAYVGKMVYGQTILNPRRGKAEGEKYRVKTDQAIVVENSPFIPVLIKPEIFAQVQQFKADRKREGVSPRALASEYLLTGVAKCRCGYGLYAYRQKGPNKEYHTYKCLGKKIKGATFCDAGPIPRHVLEAEVEKHILARYGGEVAQDQYRDALLRGVEGDVKEVRAALAQVATRSENLEEQEKRVRTDYRRGDISAAEFKELKADHEEDLQEARTQQQQLQFRLSELDERRQSVGVQLSTIAQIDKWSVLTPTERKNLLRCFLALVTVWVTEGSRELNLQFSWK